MVLTSKFFTLSAARPYSPEKWKNPPAKRTTSKQQLSQKLFFNTSISNVPPRINPATPTCGILPPITLTPKGSNAAYTSPHRPLGPRLATFLSALTVTEFSFCRSIRIPGSLMLEKPGFGEWPPLRTANLTRKKFMTFKILDTSLAEVGMMAQVGAFQHV